MAGRKRFPGKGAGLSSSDRGKKKTKANSKKPGKAGKYTLGVKGYKHESTRRILATDQTGKNMGNEEKRPRTYRPERRSTREVALSWKRTSGLETEGVASTPLFIHEKIDPNAFLASLKGDIPVQSKIFENYDGIEGSTRYKFYDHGANWQNRIIRGESTSVMASLRDRENIQKVQMIYFDPPYGMDYSAIIQANAKRPSKNSKIAADVTAMKVFRDSYKNGVHSYFDNIYRILRLARDILDESGSIFLQIGSDNVNRVGIILDEVFGFENRVQIITFAKTGGGSSDTLPGAADYILWYAKDIEKLKYRQLYTEFKTDEEWFETNTGFIMLELEDGKSRNLTSEEKKDLTKIPNNSRLFVCGQLASQNPSQTRSGPYYVKSMDETFECLKNGHWSVSEDGLDNLDEKNRLVKRGTLLRWKWYKDEMIGRRLNNIWAELSRPFDKHYIVETAESVIERCMLMSTDPGDLVYDPTCGSGTTAYVAEKWGRRWITSDAGAVAVTFARQRLATAVFDYYHLVDSEAGLVVENQIRDSMKQRRIVPDGGFSENPEKGIVVERTPKLNPSTLAYDKEPEIVFHPNRPKIDKSLRRISSPFTIETLSPYRYENPESLMERVDGDRVYAHVQKTVIEALENTGINMQGSYTRVLNVRPLRNGRCITHTGEINGKKTAILIAPPDCTIPYDMVNRAEEQASRMSSVDSVIIIGFSWEGSAYTTAEETRGKTRIYRVQASMDLQVANLKSEAGDNTLVMIGEPRITVNRKKGDPGRISVSIDGFDTYDPGTGSLREGKPNEIICWLLDTDFDGSSFFARWVHFPSGTDDNQVKKFYRLLEDHIDPELWRHVLSTRSAWFDFPKSGRIAVRIITETHMEMTEVLELDRVDISTLEQDDE